MNDEIILKVDIEGKEYDLLEEMIQNGTIEYISKIYCEWHCHGRKIFLERHERLVGKLIKLGFDITGFNATDEFIYVYNISALRRQVRKMKYYLMTFFRKVKSILGDSC